MTDVALQAIQSGDIATLERLLGQHPELASSRPDGNRTLLHVATDWPGHFPNITAIIALLIARGADVNATFHGRHSETPLHWAASSDDVSALDALLDHGANIEASGGVIAGGTPLGDAVAFGKWNAARRLVERGATTNLWQAAALGLADRVEECFVNDSPPPVEVTKAFWLACHGSQQEMTDYLLVRGADLNWVGYDHLTPLDAANRSGAHDLVSWLRSRGGKSTKEL